jgi:hypothetical protein
MISRLLGNWLLRSACFVGIELAAFLSVLRVVESRLEISVHSTQTPDKVPSHL